MTLGLFTRRPHIFTAALVAGGMISSCSRPASQSSAPVVSSPPAAAPVVDDASSEALIRHLLKRVENLNSAIADIKSKRIKDKNTCLKEQIAILEGTDHAPTTAEQIARARADQQAFANELLADTDRLAQWMLDSEAAILDHNKHHPESPQASGSDLLRTICGDCTTQRAAREAAMAAEAKSDAPPSRRKQP